MAIILPNTRNAIGVPNRYSDLAAAGLRWTPPAPEPQYTYESWDITGSSAQLYESNIDLADYQYNEDGLDLQVLPDGYKAISGASAGMAFYYYQNPISIAIDGLGMLRMKDPATGFFEIIDSNTTWSKVSGICSASSPSVFAYAIKAYGTLWAINISSGSPVIQQVGLAVGAATGWTDISGYSSGSSYTRAFGICDGALYYLNGTTATRIGISSSWTAVTGFSLSNIGYRTTIGFGIAAGNLYTIAPTYAYANEEPTATLLDNGGVWSDVSGYGQVDFSNNSYLDDYIWSTVYGIRDGNLMGIVGGYSYSDYVLSYTVEVIDGTRTYHDVWLVAAGTTNTESTGIAISKKASSSSDDEGESSSSYGMTWDNGTEPVLEEGNKVIFVTPTGAGNFSGDSWANAKAGLYTAGLAASNGDVLYLQEGTYTSHLAPVAATKSIGIYGGFTAADGTWATRDNFAHPSIIDATSNPSVPFINPESGVTQVVDGIACTNFTGGVMLKNGGTATVKNCAIYDCDGTASSHAVDNCLILNCSNNSNNIYSAIVAGGGATNCTFTDCSSSSNSSNSVIVTGAATDCTFTDCSSSNSSNSSSSIVGGAATDCTFTNCSSSGNISSYIVTGAATDCTFTNCSSDSSGSYSYIVGTTATNCTFTNCSSSGGAGSYSNSIVGDTATNCTFTNCSTRSSYGSYIVGTTATNCTISRCVAGRLTSTTSGYKVTNSVIWNSTITTMTVAFGVGTNNAASAYIDANTLVLGTDNTLANFASIGTVETIGYSASLNSTPAEDFGDFRPQAGSVLIGAGVAVDGVTTDINGVTRANPPTIGAYEYQPTE